MGQIPESGSYKWRYSRALKRANYGNVTELALQASMRSYQIVGYTTFSIRFYRRGFITSKGHEGGKISEEMRHVSAMSTQFNKYAALDVRSFGSNSTVAINAKGKNDFLSFSRWRRAISLPFSRHTHSALYLARRAPPLPSLGCRVEQSHCLRK